MSHLSNLQNSSPPPNVEPFPEHLNPCVTGLPGTGGRTPIVACVPCGRGVLNHAHVARARFAGLLDQGVLPGSWHQLRGFQEADLLGTKNGAL